MTSNSELVGKVFPKISIVTPSYNQAEYLEQTIMSVLSQDYPNLEYIIIDGGSSDGSVEIIRRYADKLHYWESVKDNGQYHAINKGFSKATGEIMAWINSSDVYYPWTLKIVAEVFSSGSDIEWITGMPTNLVTGNAPQSISLAVERNMYDIAAGDYKWIQQESVFWRRSLWDRIGGNLDTNVLYAGDFDLWLKFYRHSCLYYVNTILGGFRYHDVRRGNDVSGTYEDEAEKLYLRFRERADTTTKIRSSFVKVLVGGNVWRRKVLKKTGIFSWYKHGYVHFNFDSQSWGVIEK
jgi:glycosyltransferase involved in cell wall biosynthesis